MGKVTMTLLSVNVNKLATLRNSRGGNNPDLVQMSLKIIGWGAQGITVHPRPDERHIRKVDVYDLKAAITVELNIEGYPSDDLLKMVEDVRPAQCTLVPDPPHVLTSNAGWRVIENRDLLRRVCDRLSASGTRVSVFIDPETMLEAEYAVLKDCGVHRVELYTEKFARFWATDAGKAGRAEAVLLEYHRAALLAQSAGLGVNAGHDLTLENLTALVAQIPWMNEVSIGHALICDALEFGLPETISRYLECIRRGSRRVSVS
jgi:pyridoxine 5-phosphate synthase